MNFLAGAMIAALVGSCIASPGYLKLDLHKQAPLANRLVRRQSSAGSFDAVLTPNQGLEYLVNLTVGTPPQGLAVTLDTGSSDLWIPAASAPFCKKGQCDFGSFDPSSSSTYQVVEQAGFNITYAYPGDTDAGDWGSDTITIDGSAPIDNQQIGVASVLFDHHGVMGVGYDTNEAHNDGPSGVYQSVMDNLVKSGIIDRKAFSLYLNNPEASTGSIVFGGIDTTKYTGDLVALPLQPSPDGVVKEYYVALTGVSFTDSTGKTAPLSPQGYSQATLLDAGTTNTLLTNDVFGALALGFGAVWDAGGTGAYLIPCSLSNGTGTISYSFGGEGGITIQVPLANIVGGQIYTPDDFDDPSGGCMLSMGTTGESGGFSILGDSFLRSAYAVFDLENHVAALAQADENKASTSSIVVFPTGTAVPSATATAMATGTQLTTIKPETQVPEASISGSSLILAGTPTFNLGISSSTAIAGSGPSSLGSSGACNHAPAPTAALVGLGLAAGIMGL
ncbi:hypothetical protein A1O7_09233 [Cladophialophora yegresii CBS 114405]|uniref:Peptidase A1 domain-containing protein n=1 Tax=Cladophialophora yegresii CBS 114405 TaxID=1182544 RepID=W9VE72_9EURO|nr:uncharacterized protein A1O7_09233 [Cladophialophora yegresii CBS 114405]EXJ53897.1 hypothetical protein A1O7_09233 [Cladophialophora yegresii CBS 114405]